MGEITTAYYKERQRQIAEIHNKSLRTSSLDREYLIECLARTRLGVPVNHPDSSLIDENLTYFETVSQTRSYLKFYLPLYEDYLYDSYHAEISRKLFIIMNPKQDDITFSRIPLKKASFGDVCEKHILYKLESLRHHSDARNRKWTFDYYTMNGDIHQKYEFIFDDSAPFDAFDQAKAGEDVRNYLKLGKINSDPSAKTYRGKLFIPSYKNYPLVDAVFVDRDLEKVFFIQITSNISTHNHTYKDAKIKSDELFSELYKGKK